MKLKHNMLFAPEVDFANPDSGGGGGAADPTPTQDPPQTTQQTTPSTPTFTPDQMRDAVVAGVRAAMPQQQQQPQQMSEAEVKKLLKVWEPDAAFVDNFRQTFHGDEFDPGKAQAWFVQLRDALIAQASAYADLQAQLRARELDERYTPMLQQVQEQKRVQLQQRFLAAYPALDQYKELLPAVAQQLAASGQDFADEATAFKALAGAAEQLIKKVNPSFAVGAAQQAGQGGVKSASVSMGGSPGGQAPPKTGRASDIWGD